jgi:hypothetical protein
MQNHKIYIQVPYEEKDFAKALGARWDANKKSWYIYDSIDITLFKKWHYGLNPAIIKFTKNKNFYITRIGNIELKFSFDTSHWLLDWTEYTNRIKCDEIYWCIHNNCSLDEIVGDEYCEFCPQEIIETIQGCASAYNDNALISNTTNIEEVRKNILNDYQLLPHNHLNNNKYLYRIMHSTWIY